MFDNINELRNQIRLGEDTSLELKDLKFKGKKITNPERNAMADELGAMANTSNCVLVLGVDDQSKIIIGIDQNNLDAVELWVREICNDLITPPLFCLIKKLEISAEDGTKRSIVRIDVPKSLHVHKSPGGYFHRIGSSKREMAPEVLARLFQQRSQTRMVRFDEQLVPNATKESLDKKLYEKYKTELSPSNDEEFLLKLKLLTKNDEGKIFASVSGVLMACNEPHKLLSNAYIQAVSYRGSKQNANYQLDAKDITGPLDVQVIEACKFVKKNMKVFAVKDPARRDIPQFSNQVIFEALVNAVAHRDYSLYGSKIRLNMYSDRLELFSPGTLPNSMTIDSLLLRQSTRNELITSMLARNYIASGNNLNHRNYFMDKRGEGVPIIIRESKKLSGKNPKYNLLDDSELLLTIYGYEQPNFEAI